jgi:translation initiation factor 4E
MSDENQHPGNNVTVQETEEQPDFTIKHPLERRWTLWYDSKTKKSAAAWNDALRPVCTVSTVEEFWWCVLYPKSETRL